MNRNKAIDTFAEDLEKSISEGTFVMLSLSENLKEESTIQKIIIRKIVISKGERLSFTYREATRDNVKNYSESEAFDMLRSSLFNSYKNIRLFTVHFDLTIQHRGSKTLLQKHPPTKSELPSSEHNKQKVRPAATAQYMFKLGLVDQQGKVKPSSQDKYRQIQRYIDVLEPELRNCKPGEIFEVADMGSGKGYLTFALYDYLQSRIGLNVQITGVELRDELVQLCNRIAQDCSYKGLQFKQGAIADFSAKKLHMLVALHACDTATDDAIALGIESEVQIIVVAPCCHHQIRQEMEKGKADDFLSSIIRHGIFLERQAEMITDSIRILIMEYFGYKVKAVEFISDAHTHKNVMLIAVKKAQFKKDESIIDKINELKSRFGIEEHYLERIILK